jgi:hypothetical protein
MTPSFAVSTESTPGMFQASQKDLVKAFRGTFNGVPDEVVFETAVLPMVALMALNSSLNGLTFDGPAIVKYCVENPDHEDSKALMRLAAIFLCKVSELTLQELARGHVVIPSNN